MITGIISTSGQITGIISASGQITGIISPGQGGGGGNIQREKTAIPNDYLQEIIPDEGYDGIGKVIVDAIPSNYGHIAFNGSYLRVY